MSTLVVFEVEGLRLALPLDQVLRVVRSVEITPLPAGPEIVRGVINLHGEVVAVIDARLRFRLPQRPLSIHDQFVIARARERILALIVDSVDGIRECPPEDGAKGDAIVPGLEYVSGVVRLGDGLVVIHDLDTFLSLAEGRDLDRALAQHG